MEFSEEVIPVKTDYACDLCGEGRMRPTNKTWKVQTSNTPIYPHACSKCKHKANFPVNYPYMRFLTEDEFEAETEERH